MPNLLIFIGERPSHLEMHIKGKPEFYDAMLLSKKSNHLSSNLTYHSIPLHQTRVTIHIRENNSQFNCHHQSLQLIEGEKPLSEEDAYDIFTNFAIMDDNKVAFLMLSGRKRIRLGEKVDPRVLVASKKLDV
ncbi:hypothetical protein V7087_10740 [Neobacillus niacini]|uniref:hypothetical protein n=1 Tax=Neobacillus niacini TaxID=86668 RepID=UPI002FFFBD7F